MAAAATSTQPISIVAREQRSSSTDHLNVPSLHHHHHHAGSPMNTSSSPFLAHPHPAHLANPRYAGTSPRSAESSTSWSIHPGPLFVSAGSLGSTSGSLGANSSAGSFKSRMYPGLGCSPAAPLLNPLDPEFKFRGIVGSMESDHDSLIDPHMSQREVEQFRDFTCCGLPLRDLHALVEHFESHHVLVVDPTQPLPAHQHPHPQSAFQFTPIPLYPGDPAYGKGGVGGVDPDGLGVGNVNNGMDGNRMSNGGNGSGTNENGNEMEATATGSGPAGSEIPTSTDSSLAGALGPSSSSSPGAAAAASQALHTPNPTGSASSGFDLDDIDMDMDPEPEHEHDHEHATSPAPSASSSSSSSGSTSNCSNNNYVNNSISSNRSSPLGGGAGPLPLTQPQRFANANGANANGTRSSVSSPPDTPLLTTPVSPFATAPATPALFPWAGQGQQGQGQAIGQNINIQQAQSQVPAGPPAFDNVTLPAKHIHGGNGIFAHPYAVARRHHTHPLSPLSSCASTSTSTATSPTSASSSSTFGFGAGGNSQQQQGGQQSQQGQAQNQRMGLNNHSLHHTQSLYALRLARHATEQREREQADLMRRALKDYAPGFPSASGTNSPSSSPCAMDVSGDFFAGYEAYEAYEGAGATAGGGCATTATGLAAAGMAGMGRMSGVGPTETAIHPGLLFSNAPTNANANGNLNRGAGVVNGGVVGTMMSNGGVKTEPATARTTPAHSRSGSPSSAFASASGSGTALPLASSSNGTSSLNGQRKASNPSSSSSASAPRPTSSLLLSKPFKCPTPGCTKSYKQANGLKYHVTHGQCSFTPPPELSSISELGLSIGVNLKLGPMGLEGLENMTEAERREAEKEAERRLRPFCCQVKPCTRRYKNMNGLRYHYQHSGEHGAVGLRMLASGKHDATREQSAERSDDEEGGAGAGAVTGFRGEEMGDVKDENGGGRSGSAERGRRRERKAQASSSSAPSTPGPKSSTANNASPFTTQAFTGFAAHQQQQQQQMHLHHRSLSGSSGGQGQGQGQLQQPRSPLSQGFAPAPSSSSSSSASISQAQATAFAQAQFASMGVTPMNMNLTGTGMGGGVNGNGMLPPVTHTHTHTQFAFAVQSQPASAYASPWGSRAGSPT